MYGYNPLESDDQYFWVYTWLQPALCLTSTITSLQHLQAGEWASYGLTWKTKHPTTLATLPLWYNEWLPRSAWEWYTVYHHSTPLYLRGTICMNLCSCEIGDLSVHIGDQIEIIGSDKNKNKNNTIESLSKINNTIPYITLTSLNSSIRRIII
jgi:alanine racemase